ncbi:MAG TPA: hypothetical protein VMK12_30340 [Anaeromyxobacteraceae bacterium]|nr:hypothetical protein [Anaeromyxobacteraceae bacterium]
MTLPPGLGELLHPRPWNLQRAGVVAGPHVSPFRGPAAHHRSEGKAARVAADKGLGKQHEPGPAARRVGDELAGLVDPCPHVEERACGLHHGDLEHVDQRAWHIWPPLVTGEYTPSGS